MGIAGTLVHVCGKGSTLCVTLRSMEKHDQIIYIQIFKNQPTKVFECISLSISRKKSGIDILKQYFSDVFFRFDEAV